MFLWRSLESMSSVVTTSSLAAKETDREVEEFEEDGEDISSSLAAKWTCRRVGATRSVACLQKWSQRLASSL